MPQGTRICVAGHGRGQYVRFNRRRLQRSNTHTIAFDSGETVPVNLKKKAWTVKEAEMDGLDPAIHIKFTGLYGSRATVRDWTAGGVRRSDFPGGHDMRLWLSKFTKIAVVKQKLWEKYGGGGIPRPDQQGMLFNGEPLSDEDTLEKSKVQHNDTIIIVTRLPAAATAAAAAAEPATAAAAAEAPEPAPAPGGGDTVGGVVVRKSPGVVVRARIR